MQEWPLIIFTLLVQASVGITVFTTGTLIYAANYLGEEEKRQLALPAMLTAFITGALGLMVSTAHLGYPLNAFHALRHFDSSWLSREIIFASLYLAVLGLTTLGAMFKKQAWALPLLVASLLGIIDIYCMGAIYVHSSVVTWMHFNTWVTFYGSALAIGGIVCLLSLAAHPELPSSFVRPVALTTIAAVVVMIMVRLLEQPLFMGYLASIANSDVVTFPHQPLSAFERLSCLRMVFWFVLVSGTCMLALCLRSHRINRKMLVLGGAMVVVAEGLLRFSFFSIS